MVGQRPLKPLIGVRAPARQPVLNKLALKKTIYMKQKKSKNQKINNRHIVKEDAPYNVCDRFCERCGYQKKCRVFQDADIAQIKNVVEGKSPRYVKNVFRDLEESFRKIKATLKKVAKEEGIDIDNISMDSGRNQDYISAESSIKKTSLYKTSKRFVKSADVFLKKLFLFARNNNPFLLPALNDDIGNLSFYFGMLLPKVHYALFCFYDFGSVDNGRYVDANHSICIAINASMVCEKSICNIAREAPEFFVEHLELITMLKDIRTDIKKVFPEAERFQEGIIFNTPLR
jgi:hypothetical protein